MPELLRSIPSVERVLEERRIAELQHRLPRWVIVESTRLVLSDLRHDIEAGKRTDRPEMQEIASAIERVARRLSRRGIRRVINGTGVVIHTNLGRAILSEAARKAVQETAAAYSTLEYDLDAGARTSRTTYVEKLLTTITGSEGAFVVNNNAGAVLLALNALAQGREVVVSRGELIEIGGSFRLPDVMEKSGARMVEVGTTNRTRIEDYEHAITGETSVILKVHLSNFEMTGFVESVAARDLAPLAGRHSLILMEDLGSGALIDFSQYGLPPEPMPQHSLSCGVDVVTFSGDKLLGGPQAGVILGKAGMVDTMRRNPLARALRIDKMTLAALEAILTQYLESDSLGDTVPTLATIGMREKDIEVRARAVAERIAAGLQGILTVSVDKAMSQVGGGSLPTAGLPTYVVSLRSDTYPAARVASILRGCDTPIIARIIEDKVSIDIRTVQPSEDEVVAHQILTAFAGGGSQERS